MSTQTPVQSPVRNATPEPVPASDGGLHGSPHVVVGVDGSSGSSAALRWAMTYASQVGGTVEAIGTWQLPMGAGSAYGWVASLADGDSYAAIVDKTLTDTVADVTQSLGSTLLVQTRVSEGQAAEVLLRAAGNAQMLVVGSRGHGTMAGLILGSTSQRCVQHAPCPVVVVPE